jgi:hypothetical protein
MIIYGSKASHIATENLNETCSGCGTPNAIQMSVFQRYAHVFWIPLFPIGKVGVTQCSHCKQVLQKKEFSRNLSTSYEVMKSKTKTPVWTFSGLVMLTVLVAWGVVNGKQNDEKNAAFISTPQTGDIYEVKKDYKQYTLLKVESVAGDTVFVLANQYETNKVTGLSDIKLKGDEAYVPEPLAILKADLKSMLDKGEIIDVDRK